MLTNFHLFEFKCQLKYSLKLILKYANTAIGKKVSGFGPITSINIIDYAQMIHPMCIITVFRLNYALNSKSDRICACTRN